MKKNILLINPNWTKSKKEKQFQYNRAWQPLDITIAASMCENKGFKVKIIDNNVEFYSSEQIGIISKKFDKIFVTTSPYDRWQCPHFDITPFFDTIQNIVKDRLYIMGPHVTERYEAFLKYTQAKACILGEPEETIVALCCQQDDNFSEIEGIAYNQDDKIILNSKKNYFSNINEMPYPAFNLLPMTKYYYEFMGENFAILESSRGCPYKCSFCYKGMFGSKVRQKNVFRMIDEVKYVIKKFSVKNIYFLDLEFGLNKNFLTSFCELIIQQKIKLNWCCQTRVNDVDKDILKLMKSAGCSLIHFGIESGSKKILLDIGKNITLSNAQKAVYRSEEAGIRTAVFLNFGFPFETRNDMEKTINFAIKLNPTYVSFHLIAPFPGTEIAKKSDINTESFPINKYPSYNFVHHELMPLKRILMKAYIKFYLRLSYISKFFKYGYKLNIKQILLFLRMLKG
ncbi:MAG: B12-binding domain-containing radical SAM protein [Desulfobacterales bacterium]|nr:B12-binding domain-containing radical SAM protein [Desulfobacterales bacterium]